MKRFLKWLQSGMGLTLLTATAFVLFFMVYARAHDEAEWIEQGHYKSIESGVHCCGKGDCVRLADDDVTVREGGFWIKSLNEFVPHGFTHWASPGGFWRCHTSWGSRRCFFAMPSGS